MATPPRPRDFRITPEQAAAARGSLLDRLGRWVAAPRHAALRPLAGAALAIGLILVVVSPMLPGQDARHAGGEAGVMAPKATASTMDLQLDTPVPDAPVAGQEADSGPAGTPATGGMEAHSGPAATDGAEAHTFASQPTDQAAGPELTMRMADVTPGPSDDTTAMLRPTTPSPTDQPPAAVREADASPTTTSGIDDTAYALLLLGIVLAGTGGIILLLVWFGRRAEDPLLR